VVDHIRLFRNDPRNRWRYRVHEQILPAIRDTQAQVRWAEVVIHHTGYQEPALRRSKLQRDLRLLELEYAEQPDDPFTLFNLGCVRQELGQMAEAIPLLRRSLELSHPRDSIVRKLYALLAGCQVQLGEWGAALATVVQGRQLYPDDFELLSLEGSLRADQGDLDGGKACLLALLSARPDPHFASVADGLQGYRTRHQLGRICWRQGQAGEAEQMWRAALAERPGFIPSWLGLGDLLLAQQRWSEVEEVAHTLEGLPGAEVEAVLLRTRTCQARQDYPAARAVVGPALEHWPQALPLRIVHSHVLLQEHTDLAAAEQALHVVLALDPANAEARHNLSLLRAEREAAQGSTTTGEIV
jgi:tetratricopeptide (TPR) repeat protein